MSPLQIRDVMTREVITAPPTTPVAEIAELLTTHRISAVPIIDDNDRVLGVVSEADLLPGIPTKGMLDRALRRRPAVTKTRATHARDLMSSPRSPSVSTHRWPRPPDRCRPATSDGCRSLTMRGGYRASCHART